ncbi:hypothetical protein CI109_100399 [Kwoniella shandongensis]|uniref:Uncharacterized protein n=1 Tax=Kwoniella shandongensis TaxID=1734106 RepID=A0A5M6C3V1_9TREE|nr:uncharacterized protein CI109_001758 [Kwoniella shandongensis]KAA5529818.1 hypothetical protein CI109_001758 [Kwoniella shandongensis]
MDHDGEGDYSGVDSSDHEVKREDGQRSKGREDGKGKAKGEKKGGINRVNRACNNCRRMKMRCVGAEDPPCKRCRNGGLACVMEKPGRSATGGDAPVGEDRIRSLESQVSAIQNTLTDLVTTLRAGVSSAASSHGSNLTPIAVTNTTPDYAPSLTSLPISGTQIPTVRMDSASPNLHTGTIDPSSQLAMSSNNPNQTGFFASTPISSTNNYISQHQNGTNHPDPFRPYVNSNQARSFGFSPQQTDMLPPPPQRRPGGLDEGSRRQTISGDLNVPSVTWPSSGVIERQESHTRHMSLPPSRAGSVGPHDILAPEQIINPLGEMSNMAGLVEAAVERAREEQAAKASSQEDGTSMKRTASEMERAPSGGDLSKKPPKKARFSPSRPGGPSVFENQNLPPKAVVPGFKSESKKWHVHAFPDVVTEGFVTEEEGKEMMRLYYAGSSNFIPCFDPNVDTWDSLRARSPFSITSIIFVGARVRDGGGPPSEVQKACRAHAEKIAVGTLFHPVNRIEAVQGMILLAAFKDGGWLPGGHAVRMGIDMGINRSFIHLLRTGMGKGKSPEELEQERSLVVHSRTWFCLYLMEHQMAYGTGRPAIIREDETIHQCRRLLEHPLSITSDARLVSTVELTALRSPLHIELTASPDLPIAESTLKRLKQANQDFDAWERYWDRVLSDRFGKGRGDFFRESLIIQRQYAELFVNSQLLRGIRESSDIIGMPEEKRALAIRAMKNAQRCLDICLHGENYRNGLRYAVHYTHVCAAFAASFLIRIARLFPNELNLKKTAKDVEELASVLSEIPAGRYARSLRLILRRARRAKVIPAPSAISSPQRQAAALPTMTPRHSHEGATPAPAGASASLTAFSPSQLVNPNFYPSPGGPGVAPPTNMSPNSATVWFNANVANQMMNDSPSSGEFFEFDSLFAQETLERAGITLGEDNQLPLFLDGQSLGSLAAPTEMTPYVGLEQFFLPQEVDNQLAGPLGSGSNGQNGGGEGGTGAGGGGEGEGNGNGNHTLPDVWW